MLDGCLTSREGFFFCLLGDPLFAIFLPIEWQELTKRIPPVILSVRGGPSGNGHCKKRNNCYVCRGLKVLQKSPYHHQIRDVRCAATLTTGAKDNALYFTREQFSIGLYLPIPSLVKQFQNITRAPPALVHPIVFWNLMGCSVVNFLYELDVGSQPSITICNRALGFPQDQSKRGYYG